MGYIQRVTGIHTQPGAPTFEEYTQQVRDWEKEHNLPASSSDHLREEYISTYGGNT